MSVTSACVIYKGALCTCEKVCMQYILNNGTHVATETNTETHKHTPLEERCREHDSVLGGTAGPRGDLEVSTAQGQKLGAVGLSRGAAEGCTPRDSLSQELLLLIRSQKAPRPCVQSGTVLRLTYRKSEVTGRVC